MSARLEIHEGFLEHSFTAGQQAPSDSVVDVRQSDHEVRYTPISATLGIRMIVPPESTPAPLL